MQWSGLHSVFCLINLWCGVNSKVHPQEEEEGPAKDLWSQWK